MAAPLSYLSPNFVVAVPISGTGQIQVAAASTGVAYKVMGYCLTSASSTSDIVFQSNNTDLNAAFRPSVSEMTAEYAPDESGFCQTTSGEALNVNVAGTGVSGIIIYEVV